MRTLKTDPKVHILSAVGETPEPLIVICETCVVFYFLPRAPSKLLANLQNKNQSCKIDPTAPSVLHM